VLAVLICALSATYGRENEVKYLPKHTKRTNYVSPLPHEYLGAHEIPLEWDWNNVDGVSYLTQNFNQHIPQYCGSCWLHGGMSILQDRIKIARRSRGVDIALSRQFVLNCGTEIAGSCHGGSASGLFEFIQAYGYIPYDSCLTYEACSVESDEGTCGGRDWACKPINICRTCSTYKAKGGFCAALDVFPNATVAEYGAVAGEEKMMAEIYARGPIACGIDANPILNYTGGVYRNATATKDIDHIVEIYGWGEDKDGRFWKIRNSWGEYWGELGHFRMARGDDQQAIESDCNWVTPGSWSEDNFPCFEDGSNCVPGVNFYVDPAVRLPWHIENALKAKKL